MWIEQKFEGDPIAAVKLILSSHSTGKIILDVSQGAVRLVTWREKVTETTPPKVALDRVTA
jgi:hypothetical protein